MEGNEGFKLMTVIMTDKVTISKNTTVHVDLPYSWTRQVSRGLNFVQDPPTATKYIGGYNYCWRLEKNH